MEMRKKLLAGTVASSLLVGGFAVGRLTQVRHVQAAPAEDVPAGVTTLSVHALPSFASLATQVSPAVVYIKIVAVEKAAHSGPEFDVPPQPFGEESPFPGFRFPFPPPSREFRRQGSGSGFIIRDDGLILTNNHVVENAKKITVTLSDKQEYSAKVLGRDSKTDLAVLKIEATGHLPAARLGNSDALRVGDWVMAIGNPFGLSNTVTAGIVSAKGRTIGAGPYDDFIQTDASINPGNSGGPLFNEQGEVVGINTAIFSQSGGNIGIGFATPINLVKTLVPELETKGQVTRGWLGVSIQKITPELAQSLGLEVARGALVADVTSGSPAAHAGIERGDVIVAYSGKSIEDASALPTLVASTAVGKTIPVDVIRNGKRKTLEVAVSRLVDQTVALDESATQKGKWGLALRDLRPEERERVGLEEQAGVLVAGVQPNSPAADAGVQVGDVILEVNRHPVTSVEELKRKFDKELDDKPLLLLLHRADEGNRFATLAKR
jgi:serine protease Do